MRQTVPIVTGIQRFDDTVIPLSYNQDVGTGATGFTYDTTIGRSNNGPYAKNIILWADNAKNYYVTQRPAIRGQGTIVEGTTTASTYGYIDTCRTLFTRVYPMDEVQGTTLFDIEGNNRGVYEATTTLPAFGNARLSDDYRGSVFFHTSDNTSRARAFAGTDHDNTTGGFAVIAQIRPAGNDTDAGVHIIAGTGTSHTDEWCLFLENNVLKFRNATAGAELAGTTNFTLGETYWVAAAHRSGNATEIWIDGVSEATSSNANRETSTGALGIGNDSSGASTEDWEGNISGVCVTNGSNINQAQIDLIDDALTVDNVGSGIGRGIYHIEDDVATSVDLWISGRQIQYSFSVIGGVPVTNAATSYPDALIDDGGHKIYIDQYGENSVVMSDPEQEKIYRMTPGTIVKDITQFITDVGFVMPQAKGGHWFNNKYYLMDSNGSIFNSGSGDIESWNALNFLTAERNFDRGIHLAKHHDNLVAFGSRTIEFFYDNANPNGSPLKRRQDLVYNVGCVSDVATIEDTLYFIGSSEGTDYALYKIENYQLTKISDERVNYKLEAMAIGTLDLEISGFTTSGRHMLSIVQINKSAPIGDNERPIDYTWEVKDNLVYDVQYGALYDWESQVDACSPIIRNTASNAGIVLNNGTLGFLENSQTNLANDVDGADNTGAIEWELITHNLKMGSHRWKFWNEIGIEGSYGRRAVDTDRVEVNFSWSDDFFKTFSQPTTIDMTDVYKFSMYGLGSSTQRAFKFSGSSTAKVFLQNLIIEYDEGDS